MTISLGIIDFVVFSIISEYENTIDV